MSQGDDYVPHELVIGSWASCHDDGLYVELHLTQSNDFAYHIDGDLLDFNVGKYIFCSGKIHVSIQENDLYCNQEAVNRMEVIFISNDEFESVENGKKYIFKRLSDTPIMAFELGTKSLEQDKYMDGFKARKDTFNCPNPFLE